MKRTLFLRISDALITILIILFVTFGFLWFIHTFNVFPLPDFVNNIFSDAPIVDDENDEFEKKLLSLFEAEGESAEYEFLALTPDKANEILSAFTPPENYFWTVETVFKYGDAERRQVHRIYKKGSLIRVDTTDDITDTTTVYTQGETVTVNNKTGAVKKDAVTDAFNLSNTVSVATLSDMFINSDPEVLKITLAESEDKRYLYAEIKKGGGVDGSDRYFVSLDSGIVVSAVSEMGGSEYFTQTTHTFDSSSVISDTFFDISTLEKEASLIRQ